VLLVALGISLGQWQDRRAAAKIALQQTLSTRAAAGPLVIGPQPVTSEAVAFSPVSVRGEFITGWPVFLDNRPQNGKVGFYLLMPLRIDGSSTHVLVARGWLPRYTAEHGRLPVFTTPSGTVTITGVAKPMMARVMQLGTPAPLTPKAIVQNIVPADFAKASGLTVQPFFIEQTDPTAAAEQLVRDWPAATLNVDKHRGYAFQWYALAVMALLFFVITGCRRGTD